MARITMKSAIKYETLIESAVRLGHPNKFAQPVVIRCKAIHVSNVYRPETANLLRLSRKREHTTYQSLSEEQ